MIRLFSARSKSKPLLKDIFEDDDALLDVAPLKIKAPSIDLSSSQLEDIASFFKQHARLPRSNPNNIEETRLARRLSAFQNNPQYHDALNKMGLNAAPSNEEERPLEKPLDKSEFVQSLQDIFEDDDDLLDFDSPDIFTLTHVSHEKKIQPDEIAKRQPCPDFPRFSSLFSSVQEGLKKGAFSLLRFRHELQMQEGDFFTLHGVLGYVYKAGEKLEGYSSYNARLHLVFENGTESNMLFQSLTHGLVRDKEGRKVSLNGQNSSLAICPPQAAPFMYSPLKANKQHLHLLKQTFTKLALPKEK